MSRLTFHFIALGVMALAPWAAGVPTARIEWQPDTLTLIQSGGYYGRIIRLQSNNLLSCYTRHGKAYVKHSADNGKTWNDETLAATYTDGGADNTELIQLGDGRVMLMVNERNRINPRQNGIAIAFSSDNGRTWTAPMRIYTGKCWEPAAIERDHPKTIEIYFANEEPYQQANNNDQNISVMSSVDGGRRWAGPAVVSYRKNHRDGMPVPLKLNSGKVVIAIEDPGLLGDFKPVILDFSRRRNAPIIGDSPYRWSALADPLPAETYAGAPYIVQMPSGQTLLSYRCKPQGTSHHTMTVTVGTEDARCFQNPAAPFSMADKNTSQNWSALFVKDKTTITAVSGATINNTTGLWAIDGTLSQPAPSP